MVGRKRESTCIVAPLTAKGKLALQAGNHNQYKLIRQLGYLMTAPDPKQRTVELEECVNQWPGHPDHILIEKSVCETHGNNRLRKSCCDLSV